MNHPLPDKPAMRLVLTGGPGGGKTTAADLFLRELGDRVVLVPESATILFTGGFPRVDDADARRAAQTAIYHVQRNLEDVQSARYPRRILLCDRGTLDGAAYWPGTPEAFFAAMNSSYEAELARYDAVVFFESAAAGGLKFEGENRVRTETAEEARALDKKMRAVWSAHPKFFLVPHRPSFFETISMGLAILQSIVAQVETARAGE
ncbi:MAG: AAA family ATPase [Polyangiaceae bacterium]